MGWDHHLLTLLAAWEALWLCPSTHPCPSMFLCLELPNNSQGSLSYPPDFLAFCPSDPLSHSFQALPRQTTSLLPPKDQNSASVFFVVVHVLCQIWDCLWQAHFSFQRSGGTVKDIQFLDSQNPLPKSLLQCEWHYLGDPEISTYLSIWLRTAVGNGLQSCSNVIEWHRKVL